MRPMLSGISTQGRNRRCITVDMRQEEGRDIIKQLANNVDVLVENFRPGVMEKWRLGPKVSMLFFSVTDVSHSMPASPSSCLRPACWSDV